MRFQWLDRILFEADMALWQLRARTWQSANAYCDLETVDDATTLAASDGSLCSILRIEGTKDTVGPANIDSLIERISEQVGAYMRAPGHYLQLVFERDTDPRRVERSIRSAMAPSMATVTRLGLALEDLEEEKLATLATYCAIENAYLVAWTLPSALTVADRHAAGKERMALARKRPPAMLSQIEGAGIAALRELHGSLVSALTRDLRAERVVTNVLPVDESLRAIRMMVDSEWTDEAWRPAFPGDGVDPLQRVRRPERGAPRDDASSGLWLPLARQLIPRGFENVSPTIARIGGRLHQPVVMSLGPATLRPFSELFARLRESGIPYRISFRITGSGTETVEYTLRRIVAYVSTTRTAKDALAEAGEAARQQEVRVGLQVAACTWVGDGNRETLRRNTSRLARAIQGWGGCEVSDRIGAPARAVFSTFPALRRVGAGPMAVPPIEDAMAMLPWTRPASPWADGAFLLRTDDGKLYPYQAGSSKQTAGVNLVYAPMGSGKSVWLSAFNKALAISPGISHLPRISILDIGPSSSGLISLMREALPPSQQHLVLYHRMRMHADDAINPCDLPVGMRAPLPFHRAYLVNLLTLFATPIDGTTPPDVPHLAGTVVDLAYREYGDDGSRVRRYDRNVDPAVDSLVDELGLHVDHHTTWFEIVDALFEHGQTHGALLAQRYAVPLIGEMAALARDPVVTQQFRGTAPNGESVTDFFYRSVTMTVREYPILATATRLDMGDARIVSLDLEEVAPRGGATADRQTAVMYMIARHVLASNLLYRPEHVQVAVMPAQYRAHHTREFQRLLDETKVLCFDEFHRTRSAPLAREQTKLDIREGRKNNLGVTLASQLLDDFDSEMVDLATTIIVLGVGEKSLEQTVRTFRLNEEAERILSYLAKPTREGARFLAKFKTGDGDYVASLTLTLSATELWAYSTTSEDRGIRDRLYRLLGAVEARKRLVRRFPDGTAKPEVERRRFAMTTDMDEQDAQQTVIESIVQELVEEA